LTVYDLPPSTFKDHCELGRPSSIGGPCEDRVPIDLGDLGPVRQF